MKPAMTELEELNLLLEMVRSARSQIQVGEQPTLGSFLRRRGIGKAQTLHLAARWAELAKRILAETPPTTVSARTPELRSGAMRLLLACFVPDYQNRLVEDPRTAEAPRNERRLMLNLSADELRCLLEASLIDGAWAENSCIISEEGAF